MIPKNITWVDKRNDPETCAAIVNNDFQAPVPVEENENGYWVTKHSLELYRQREAAP